MSVNITKHNANITSPLYFIIRERKIIEIFGYQQQSGVSRMNAPTTNYGGGRRTIVVDIQKP